MLKSAGKESFKEIVKNLEFLDPQQGEATKFRRRLPEMSSEEYNLYL